MMHVFAIIWDNCCLSSGEDIEHCIDPTNMIKHKKQKHVELFRLFIFKLLNQIIKIMTAGPAGRGRGEKMTGVAVRVERGASSPDAGHIARRRAQGLPLTDHTGTQ